MVALAALLVMTLTMNKPVCLSAPCDAIGTLVLSPNEYNRELIVEADPDRPSGVYRAYTVTLNGKEKLVQLTFNFKGPAIYTLKVTLRRADGQRGVVTREFRVAVEEEPQSGTKR